MAGLAGDAGERNPHLSGIAEADMHFDRQRTDEMLLRSAEGWKAALHANEEDDRQMLLQRDVADTLQR